jgi:hypothetical protein
MIIQLKRASRINQRQRLVKIPASIFSFLVLKKSCIYENGLGNAHPALCSTFL